MPAFFVVALFEAESATAEFELPEIIQATFYAMLLNEVVELGVVHDYTGEKMKASLIGLRWSTSRFGWIAWIAR